MGTKFTKGEWKIDADRHDLEDTIITDKGVRIAEVKSFGEGFNDAPCEERAANSKLIAAAPEMYKVLEETDKDLCVLETTMRQIELYDKRAEGMTDLIIKWRERNNVALKKATE